MKPKNLLDRLARKGIDPAKIASEVIRNLGTLPYLIDGLNSEKPEVKYNCEKVIREISAQYPDALYPQFDLFAGMLECKNSFLKWGAIRTIANLAIADPENRFEAIFEKYFAPIRGPAMVTAANTIGSSARIALARPQLAVRISKEILKVQKAEYRTPECRNVAIGHAIDAFDLFLDCIPDPGDIVRFVKKQLKNTRAPVRKRAELFFRKRGMPF